MGATLRNISAVLALSSSSALCFSQSGEDKQASLAAHLQKAKAYLDEKRPDLAIPELQAAAAIDPENVETRGNLGVLLYFQGKALDAVPHLRAAVDRQPGMGKIQGLLGLAEIRTLDFVQGRKDLEAAFPLIGDQKFKVEVGLELVGVYTQSSDLEAASVVVAQLRRAAPDNAEVLYAAYRTYSDLSGHEETRQGNTNGALGQFRKAIAIDPHLPGVHFELAELLHTSQDAAAKNESEREYRAARAENPQDEKSIFRLAEIDSEKGNIQQSEEEYTQALALQPADADAKLGLAKTLIQMNQTDKAQRFLEETVQLEPTNATAHYRLSTLYRKIGRVEDAKKEVELYKKYKDMKEKLRALYQELQIQPKEIGADELDQK